MRVAWHQRQEEWSQYRNECQKLEDVHLAGVQRGGSDQFRVEGIHLPWGKRASVRVERQPQVNVIAVGVEILGGMCEPSKGGPRRRSIAGDQRGDRQRALLLDVRARFFEGILVEVILGMTDLPAKPILMEIGSDDLLERPRTEYIPQCEMHDFHVKLFKHPAIISEATLRVSEATLWVSEATLWVSEVRVGAQQAFPVGPQP